MARRNKASGYAYSWTAMIRGREDHGRYAVIRQDREHARVVRRRADGTAAGTGELVRIGDLFDAKPTQIVPVGLRGTVTLPGEMRRNLGFEDGTPVEVIQEDDGTLSLRPLCRIIPTATGLQLNDLLDRVTPDNLHGEIATGAAAGREGW